MAVKIVVDSSSDITEKEAQELGITMLAIPINFGDEDYFDGVDISKAEFYDKLAMCDELPKTSQVSFFRFEEVFESHVRNGDEVVAIVLSSQLSATYNSAVQASEKFKEKTVGKIWMGSDDHRRQCHFRRRLCHFSGSE